MQKSCLAELVIYNEINFSAPGARESIRNKLRNEQFEVITSSLGEVCFEIMKAFLNKFKNGELL